MKWICWLPLPLSLRFISNTDPLHLILLQTFSILPFCTTIGVKTHKFREGEVNLIYRGPVPYIDHIQNTDVAGKLALLLPNREVPGSLSPDWDCLDLLSTPGKMPEYYLRLRNDRFLSRPYRLVINKSSQHSTLYNRRCWQRLWSSVNKQYHYKLQYTQEHNSAVNAKLQYTQEHNSAVNAKLPYTQEHNSAVNAKLQYTQEHISAVNAKLPYTQEHNSAVNAKK
jgi:hypothetical protein